MTDLLPRDFYARDSLEVAADLLGALLYQDQILLKITETEAYRWPEDTANHGCVHGRTQRNEALWGPPGLAYVYLCYGIHYLFNVATGEAGQSAAVLIRACEPVAGFELIQSRRRGQLLKPNLLAGPGKIGAALGLNLSWNHHPVYEAGGLEIRAGDQITDYLIGPRVGIDSAKPEHRDAPWRFAIADNPWVSCRSKLRSRAKN
ncbi:DNA-3-methyladenine glycosylase [Candidatus Nitrosoglobus terrae]|uniref:Putative 3-methyladenine DNA glycosylase n=1 Tax=Candidatus Nitrosoglobus terrae TaxID=1630141 RepID=A0A1Q2SL63_9GAMM|nr:DNA-3-methyladenine glycosylase [Candidatus Nitrosoglobus terrae]BAW79860.1 DNA-3-methyladenine glycosylase [Candidatus Nitrosoglobus terrae]